MSFDTFLNLPAHPLLVHVPVVCIPLAAIGAIALAVRPKWRRPYGPIVVALAAIGAIGAQLAIMSGEALQESRHIRNLGDHGDYGELTRTLTIILFGLVVVLYGIDRWKSHARLRRVPAWAAIALAVLTIAGAGGATTAAVLAGHSGAKIVWKDPSTVSAK
jgi:uncharacterized membrane protein